MKNDSSGKGNIKLLTKYAKKEYIETSDKVLFNHVEKQLKKLPEFIVLKLLAWARSVELKGIQEVRKISGYHDEPLKGTRQGQRSIRLSKAYRAIYTEQAAGEVKLIIIEEVNKHEY
jgi:proteic killer suppression protein